jgi:hypothetical protein
MDATTLDVCGYLESTSSERATMATDKERPVAGPALVAIFTSFAEGLGLDKTSAHELARVPRVEVFEARELIPALVAFAVECGASPRRCVYVSTPITTGRGYHERLIANGNGGNAALSSTDKAEVEEANKRRARGIVDRLREALQATVIDPTRLVNVPDWAQDDYYILWKKMIETYARSVVFLDDWQYSKGCVEEFSEAVKCGLPIMDRGMEEFTYEEGVRLVRASVAVLGASSPSGARLLRILHDVENRLSQDADNPNGGSRRLGG